MSKEWKRLAAGLFAAAMIGTGVPAAALPVSAEELPAQEQQQSTVPDMKQFLGMNIYDAAARLGLEVRENSDGKTLAASGKNLILIGSPDVCGVFVTGPSDFSCSSIPYGVDFEATRNQILANGWTEVAAESYGSYFMPPEKNGILAVNRSNSDGTIYWISYLDLTVLSQ